MINIFHLCAAITHKSINLEKIKWSFAFTHVEIFLIIETFLRPAFSMDFETEIPRG